VNKKRKREESQTPFSGGWFQRHYGEKNTGVQWDREKKVEGRWCKRGPCNSGRGRVGVGSGGGGGVNKKGGTMRWKGFQMEAGTILKKTKKKKKRHRRKSTSPNAGCGSKQKNRKDLGRRNNGRMKSYESGEKTRLVIETGEKDMTREEIGRHNTVRK